MISWIANNERVYAPTRDIALSLFSLKGHTVNVDDIKYCGPERRKKKR